MREYLEGLHGVNKELLGRAYRHYLMFGECWCKINNNMETRNVKLTLEQAKEFYKKGGELKTIALTAYTEKELNPLPKSWAEFCLRNDVKEEEAFIATTGIVTPWGERSLRSAKTDKNLLPSKKSAEAHLAMMQLEQLRDCYRQGWEPDWDDSNKKWCIIAQGSSINRVAEFLDTVHFLSFQSKEVANEFLRLC